MLNISERCKSAFISHAIASNYDESISMPNNVGESLLEKKEFNGPDILSRYLFSYHMKQFAIGEITNYIYKAALSKSQTTPNSSSITRQDFLLHSSDITEYVKGIDQQLNGLTAGCAPAQRSFPLALYAQIDDADLFELSKKEAALTHLSPVAGQVAGVVNRICRSLLRKATWSDAVHSGFVLPGLPIDIISVSNRYMRCSDPFSQTHAAYAPTVLNAALYFVHQSTNAKEAIEKARAKGSCYCLPIVGCISGIRWGIPVEMYTNKVSDPKFLTMCDTAERLSNTWPVENKEVFS